MTKNNFNFYNQYYSFLPSGYRLIIKKKTGASISLIDKVLRGQHPDKKGIIVAAMEIVNAEIERQKQQSKKLALLHKNLKSNLSE